MTFRATSIAPDKRVVNAEPIRYQAERLLGRGGMAHVYEATDRATGRRVALKRLQQLSDTYSQERNLALFEREFHTLAQLAHPRIVRVFDFGVDQEGAYYAMELLEGGDLQELAPLPWRRACAIARDICSALSLVHSRRFVHRDVSPRNVRCLKDGPAKLIDFGAMAPMGPTKLLVGTPPCCAPESVHLQSLDGRTDLFGLGATLYFLLVGQHAYPARNFAALPSLWPMGLPAPSELVRDIPAALDALVLDLLRIEPDARPASASEVMERLSAIDGEVADEQLLAARAYLATPTLVGRDAALARVRRRTRRVSARRSRSVLIEGASGVGRTRFLDACLLDATLTGQTIVRVDSDDAAPGDYAVVRAIARQLLEVVPQLARETAKPLLARLCSVIPELATEAHPANDVVLPRAHLQRALHEWLTNLSQRQPFTLAVDDFHRIDEPSAALIALLEHDSTRHELCLLLTVERGAPWTAESARKLLERLTTLQLDPLSPEDSEKLLRSVFGAVPHVELLAHRVRDLCAGSPRDLLRLAQHLVDRGMVRYTAGAWTLPSDIDTADLPSSLSDALASRIALLPDTARELGRVFALVPDESFSFHECARLGGGLDAATCAAALEALISADILRRSGDDAVLRVRSWVPLLRADLTREHEQHLERRLAETFEARANQEFRAAQHWLRAGEKSRALELLVRHADISQELTARGPEIFLRYLLSLPEAWFETFQEALRCCEELGRPRKEHYLLLSRLVGIMAMLNTHAADLLEALFVHLRLDSGYDDWHALDASMEPMARLQAALTRTQERYNAQSEQERVLDPVSAIRGLTRAVVAASAPISMALDVTTLRQLPQLHFLAVLSPALQASVMLLDGVDARCTGRLPEARRLYAKLLEIMDRPDRGGMEESFAVYLRLGVVNGLGMVEAGLGQRSALKWAEQLESHPNYEVNANVIRMLDCLFQGDVTGADNYKRIADRLRIQNSGRQMFEGGHLLWEVQAHAFSGDLTRVRQTSAEIAPLAKRYPQWMPVLRYATAEYLRITRDFVRAQLDLQKILTDIAAGSHQIWPAAAAAHVHTLIELGRAEHAHELAQRYLDAAERELGYAPGPLQIAAALARAHAGESAEAAAALEKLLEWQTQNAVTGLHVGLAYEARARVALLQRDSAGFSHYSELCYQRFCAHKSAALTGKYHRLMQDAKGSNSRTAERGRITPDSAASYGGTRIGLALAGCREAEQRARLALTFLIAQSGATAGVLYLNNDERMVCAAQIGPVAHTPELLTRIRNHVSVQLETSAEDTVTRTDIGPGGGTWSDAEGRSWRSILICHYDATKLIVTGAAALAVSPGADFASPASTAAAISMFYSAVSATSLLASD